MCASVSYSWTKSWYKHWLTSLAFWFKIMKEPGLTGRENTPLLEGKNENYFTTSHVLSSKQSLENLPIDQYYHVSVKVLA